MSPKPEIDFTEVIKRCNGMLVPEGYEYIQKTATRVKSGIILEIGTAHGAATIALASGYRSTNPKAKVITTDKVMGGSREQYGDTNDHLRIVNDNFKHFGVDNVIDARASSSEELTLPEDTEIGGLMIDADGAIDRDLMLFYDRLPAGAPIIIDDYNVEGVRLYRTGNKVFVDQKQQIATLLIHYFEDKGLLERDRIVGGTWFGKKPDSATTPATYNLAEINAIYRQLTFSTGHLHSRAAEFISTITRKFPAVHRVLKSWYLK